MKRVIHQPTTALVHEDVCLETRFRGNLDWALAFFDRAEQIRPGDARIWHGRGDAYHVNGALEPVPAAYDAALRLAPERVDTLLARSVVRRKLHNLAGANADCERVLALTDKPNLRRKAETCLAEQPVQFTTYAARRCRLMFPCAGI